MKTLITFLYLFAATIGICQDDTSFIKMLRHPIYVTEYDDFRNKMFNLNSSKYASILPENVIRVYQSYNNNIDSLQKEFKNLQEIKFIPYRSINEKDFKQSRLLSLSMNFAQRNPEINNGRGLKFLDSRSNLKNLYYISIQQYNLPLDRFLVNSNIRVLNLTDNKEIDFFPVNGLSNTKLFFIDEMYEESPELFFVKYWYKDIKCVTVKKELINIGYIIPSFPSLSFEYQMTFMYERIMLDKLFNTINYEFIPNGDDSIAQKELNLKRGLPKVGIPLLRMDSLLNISNVDSLFQYIKYVTLKNYFKINEFKEYSVEIINKGNKQTIQVSDGNFLRLQTEVSNSLLDGEMLIYHKNGVLKERRHYKNGIPVASWEKYDFLGRLIVNIEYKKKMKYKYFYYHKNVVKPYLIVSFIENNEKSLKFKNIE